MNYVFGKMLLPHYYEILILSTTGFMSGATEEKRVLITYRSFSLYIYLKFEWEYKTTGWVPHAVMSLIAFR